MKETPDEKLIKENFAPGKISRDGFLGSDDRNIHDIIAQDNQTLLSLDISHEEIAKNLQMLIDEGKKGLESPIDYGNFIIQVQWSRGALPCPFGDKIFVPKIMATVHHKQLNHTIKFSQLSVHLIGKHGFFGGKGSHFRLEPVDLVGFLDLKR
ncbi:hypothetical protein JW964_27105 [candidate division KSB1 bacterium]|nr:hypothetical protein [candidate division KSB1 bacterium]